MHEAERQDLADVVASLAAVLELPARMSALEAELRAVRAEVVALRQALPPTLVPLAEAARMTGVSLSTLRRRVKTGELPVVRLGRAVRVDVATLRPASEAEVTRLALAARHDPR